MLHLQDLSLNFSGIQAIRDLTWHIPRSGISGIIGPNGAGKSTIFNLITGIYKPGSGSITLYDKLISNLKTEEIAALGIARTFQNIRLLPDLSTMDNLIFASAHQRAHTFFSSLISISSSYLRSSCNLSLSSLNLFHQFQ